jgi:hypothetical protein
MESIAKIKPKSNSLLKYRLDQAFTKLPNGTSKKEVISMIKSEGISKATFYRHLKIYLSDKTSIKESHLQLYAQIFGVTTEWLANYTLENPSIAQIKHAKKVAEDFKATL